MCVYTSAAQSEIVSLKSNEFLIVICIVIYFILLSHIPIDLGLSQHIFFFHTSPLLVNWVVTSFIAISYFTQTKHNFMHCIKYVIISNFYIINLHELTPFVLGGTQKLMNAICYNPYILLSPLYIHRFKHAVIQARRLRVIWTWVHSFLIFNYDLLKLYAGE